MPVFLTTANSRPAAPSGRFSSHSYRLPDLLLALKAPKGSGDTDQHAKLPLQRSALLHQVLQNEMMAAALYPFTVIWYTWSPRLMSRCQRR